MDALTRQVTACHVSGWHAWARQSDAVRIEHNRGTKDGIEYWDCPFCASTHCRDVRPTRDADVSRADEDPECAAALERITDFDDVEPATRLDRVAWMVSDEMMAADRAQREAAFTVPL